MKLFIDLECNGAEVIETIQIGAVMTNDDFDKKCVFSTYVKPSKPITPYVEKLTGITNKAVSNAPEFRQAMKLMHEWFQDTVQQLNSAEKEKCLSYVWGEDFKLLKRQSKENLCEKIYKEMFPDNCRIDYQKNFSKCVEYDNRVLSKRISLTDAKRLLGIDHETEHDALMDALDTYQVFYKKEIMEQGFDDSVLFKMYEEKKSHMERMEKDKEDSVKRYFDFIEEYGDVACANIDDELFRLLKSGPVSIFDKIAKCVDDPCLFSKRRECRFVPNKISVNMVLHNLDGVLRIDAIVNIDNEPHGYFKLKTNDDNKAFVKKLLKKIYKTSRPS